MLPCTTKIEELTFKPKGVIFSGGGQLTYLPCIRFRDDQYADFCAKVPHLYMTPGLLVSFGKTCPSNRDPRTNWSKMLIPRSLTWECPSLVSAMAARRLLGGQMLKMLPVVRPGNMVTLYVHSGQTLASRRRALYTTAANISIIGCHY